MEENSLNISISQKTNYINKTFKTKKRVRFNNKTLLSKMKTININ